MNAINTQTGIVDATKSELRPDAAELRMVKIFVVSYVPQILRDRSANIAVVMVGEGFADVRFARDWQGVLALDPEADTELLTELAREIRDKLRVPDQGEEMLRQMEDSWSNSIQISAGKGCLTKDPTAEIETLASQYLQMTR
jgi:hypothetical protein